MVMMRPSWLGARLAMAGVFWLVAWLLHRFGSGLSTSFVAGTLRPLIWMATVWLFFMLLWEAVLAASLPLLGWFTLFVVANALYIPLAEEPGLVKRFGEDYLSYKQNVPRWVPRLRGWPTQPPGQDTKT